MSVEELSNRELQIARAYAEGESYSATAAKLSIAPSTVCTHLGTIYRKLGVSSKLELHHLFGEHAGTGKEVGVQMPDLPDKPSIAVLPFDNMSGDLEQEYFADGMAEEITTALSRSPWLFVIARNSTFTYKNTPVDAKQICRELGVRFLLEGSVRKSANRIRVTAKMIDSVSGGHIWSERYDRVLEDIFDLQDEITRNVVASIQTQVHLNSDFQIRQVRRPSLTVWELTMRAWKLLHDFDPGSYVKAAELLNSAIELDSESAEAHYVLSLIHHHEAFMGFVKDFVPLQEKANELALKATRLVDKNEYAHWALGISYWGVGDVKKSIASLERAIELNPNCSVAYGSLGTGLALAGRVEESIRHTEIAIRSNPRDPSIFFRFTGIGLANYLGQYYDEAISWAEKSLNRMPIWYFGHFLLVASQAKLDQWDDTRHAARQCLNLIPNASVEQRDRFPLHDQDAMDELRDLLRQAGIPG